MLSGLYDPQCPVLYISHKKGSGNICGGGEKRRRDERKEGKKGGRKEGRKEKGEREGRKEKKRKKISQVEKKEGKMETCP